MKQKVVSTSQKVKSKSNTKYAPEEFNLNLGTIVRQQLHERNKKQLDLAKVLNITTVGISGKLNSPIYGSIYDIIKTSQFLQVDLFHLIRKELIKRGNTVFLGQEEEAIKLSEELKERITLMTAENDLLQKLAKVRERLK